MSDAAERFGDYLLVDRIAQGGMAELFLAKRTGVEGFEKVVAVKRILPELSLAQDFVAMFINEAKIAARLTHPNIVQIFDFGKVEDHYFIAMEYVHGENLRLILNRAKEKGLPFPQDLAALVIARTCAALDHAHRKRDTNGNPLHIVHRDVSPQNVLVSYEGEVKVVDFGIAKAVAENPEATKGVLKGKLAYLSPEQVTGRKLDGRADVFAAGAVLYELLAGRRLFDQGSSGEILDAIVKIDGAEVAARLPKVHKRLRDVLERALQNDRDRRYASAGEMQRALEDHLRERGDAGGTLQLSNFMRLLFDEKIGDRTLEQLRSEILKTIEASEAASGGSGLPKIPLSPRVLAAGAGALLGLVALLVVPPRPGPAVQSGPSPDATAPGDEGGSSASGGVASGAAPGKATGARGTGGEVESPGPGVTGDERLASRRGEEAAAEPTVTAPVEAPPGSAEAEEALDALEQKRFGKAIERFEVAFAAAPSLRERHAEDYGRALSAEGRRLFEAESPEAEKRFEAAVAAAPDLFEPHFYLAKIRTRDATLGKAIDHYREAIRIDPKHADARFNLGYLYIREPDYEKALEQYQVALDLRPPYLEDVVYNLSVCYERLGRRDDAVAALRKGLEELPQSQLLEQRLKQLGGGQG